MGRVHDLCVHARMFTPSTTQVPIAPNHSLEVVGIATQKGNQSRSIPTPVQDARCRGRTSVGVSGDHSCRSCRHGLLLLHMLLDMSELYKSEGREGFPFRRAEF